MNKKKLIIIIVAFALLAFAFIGLIICDTYKNATFVEKDGVQYQLERDEAVIVDGTKAKKSKYTFKEIRGKRITRIANDAFKDNKKINIVVAPYLENVGANAFDNSNLEEFNAERTEDTWIGLGNEAFKNCLNLKTVILNQTILYPDAFENCGEFDLTLADSSYVAREQGAYHFCNSPFRNTSLSSIRLLETKDKRLSYENGVLVSESLYFFNLPMGIDATYTLNKKAILYVDKSISNLSFDDDDVIILFAGISNHLKSIEVKESNPYYSSLEGVLYSKNQDILFYFPSDSSCTNISPLVKIVSSAAFYGNYGNKDLVFPDNISFLPYAFVGVENLNADLNHPKIMMEDSILDCIFKYTNYN